MRKNIMDYNNAQKYYLNYNNRKILILSLKRVNDICF